MPRKSVNDVTYEYVSFVENLDYCISGTEYVLSVRDDIANGLVRDLIEELMRVILSNELCDDHFMEACEIIRDLLDYVIREE